MAKMINDLLFRDDEAILSFLEMTHAMYKVEKPNDTYNKKRKNKMELLLENLNDMDEHFDEKPGRLNIKGALYLEQKKYHDAIKCFLKAIEIAPTNKAFWNNLSIAYYAIGEKRKAIDCFKEALLLEKENGSINTEGPDFYLKGKTLEEYLEEIDKYSIEDIPPLALHSLPTLANVYSGIGNAVCELKCLIRLVRFDQENPELYYQMARCLLSLGDRERAINFLKKALKYNPDDVIVLDTLVTIHFGKFDFRNASKYLKMIHEINPDDTEIILDLAAAHAELGEKKETISYLKKCLEIDKSYLPAIKTDPSFQSYLKEINAIIKSI